MTVEDKSWLVVDLEGEYVEADLSPLQRLLGRHARTLASLLSELAKAERDERLAGVLLRVRSLDVGWGKAQDLRAAVLRLREKGKRTVAYLELEKYGANVEYYVASAADAVYVAPATRTPLVGLAAEHLFLGGLFEKLGVKLEYERVGKYKSAVEGLAEREMSDANREMSDAILDSIQSQFLGDIAASRGMTREALAAAIDRAPTSPRELAAGEADRRRRLLRRDRRRGGRPAPRRGRGLRARRRVGRRLLARGHLRADLRRRLRRGGRGPLRAQRRAGDGVGHARRGVRAGRRAAPRCAPSCSASTAPAARRSPRT